MFIDPLGLGEKWKDYKTVGNTFTLLRANSMANEALVAAREWAKERHLPGQHNGAPDAFRHCFWSCTMAQYLGEGVAETIADEHEKEGNRHGQPHNEELMDRANNLVGRTCAARNKNRNCWDACTDRYNQGLLFGMGAQPLVPNP